MTIPQHPTLAWPPIEIEVVGYRLVDAFETAALKAITTFCEHHLNEVAAYPIGLFSAVSAGNTVALQDHSLWTLSWRCS